MALDMPKRTGATMLVSYPRPDSFIHFAERGFFAYDWVDIHRTTANRGHCYEMVSKPDVPIHILELPMEFQTQLWTLTLTELRFGQCPAIDIQHHFNCVSAD